MGGRLELTSVTGPEDDAVAILPGGWRPRIYQLRAGRLHLTRKYIELAPGLSVEETRLLAGAIRIGGVFDPGLLKIGFFETEEIRILGNQVSNAVMALAYGGARFDSASAVPGVALTLSFSPALARRVVPDAALPRLLDLLGGANGLSTLLHPVTPRAAALREVMRQLLARAEDGAGPWPPLTPDDLVAMSASLMEHVLGSDIRIPGMSAGRRRELALAIEGLLWEPPSPEGWRRLSLDDASQRLKTSRRSIQLALHEEFGMGFVALKRAIRLHQVHAALKMEPRSGIGAIARAHEFFHLSRFARHYREMFGVLPSTELDDATGPLPQQDNWR